MPISAAVCMFQPGSVKIGGTWHVAQRALPLKTSLPRARRPRIEAAARGGTGAGIDELVELQRRQLRA